MPDLQEKMVLPSRLPPDQLRAGQDLRTTDGGAEDFHPVLGSHLARGPEPACPDPHRSTTRPSYLPYCPRHPALGPSVTPAASSQPIGIESACPTLRPAPPSRFLGIPLPYEADVIAQHIKLVGVRKGHLHLVHFPLDLVEPLESLGALLGLLLRKQHPLQRDQDAVPAVDARPDPPAVKRRHHFQARYEQHHDRDEYHEKTVHQGRQPEGEIAV